MIIPSSNENFQFELLNYSNTNFKPIFRNNFLILNNDLFILFKNLNNILNFPFFLNLKILFLEKNINNLSLISTKNLNININFHENHFNIFINNIQVQQDFDINNWINLSFFIKKDSIDINIDKIFIENIKLNNLLEEIEEINILNGIKCFLENIEIEKYNEEIKQPFNYFIDYKMIDMYSIRICDEQCKYSKKEYNKELKKEISVPNIRINLEDTIVCPFIENGFDPFLKIFNNECSHTTLYPINKNYPKIFNNEFIQSPHYKIEINLNFQPFTETSILDEEQSNILFNIFEEWRPVSRTSHYEIKVDLETDFSFNKFSLYPSLIGPNFYTNCVYPKQLVDNSFIFTAGEIGFENTQQQWIINHKLNESNLIVHSFDTNNKMIYPKNQFVKNLNEYIIDWTPNYQNGYALLFEAQNLEINDILSKPIFIEIEGPVSEPTLVQLQDNLLYREEPKNFKIIDTQTQIELLESFKNGQFLAIKPDVYFFINEKSKEWIIEHNFGIQGILTQIYTKDWNIHIPSEVILESKNKLRILFDKETDGIIGLKKVGNPYWKNELIDSIINGGYFILGDLLNKKIDYNWSDTFKFLDKNQKRTLQSNKTLKVDIIDYYETKDSYYFIGKKNSEDFIENFNINEIGLFNNLNELCFYSVGNDIFILNEFNLHITFKILKENKN